MINGTFLTIKKIYGHFMSEPLYQNSIFMMAATFVMAMFGFVFWIVIAHIFSVDDIGIASAVISLMTLITSITHLGLNVGIIRYLPKSKFKNDTITTSSILVSITTITVVSLFLLALKLISPQLHFLQSNIFYILSFTIFIIGASINFLIEGIFMAFRAARNILIKNMVLSILKLVFPLLLIPFGAYGIFAAISLATITGVLTSYAILIYKYNYRPAPVFNTRVLKEMAHFSGGNYIAGFLFQASTLLLPLLIVNFLHAKAAAYYYIDSLFLNLLTIIPLATTDSLLAEGSYDATRIKDHLIKAAKIIFLLLIPAICVMFFFGNIILHYFGKNFEIEAFQFLRLISLSAVPIAITYLGTAILRIRQQIYMLILMSFLGSALVLGFSYLFISYGLIGVGWGWFLGQAIIAMIYLIHIGAPWLCKPENQKNRMLLPARAEHAKESWPSLRISHRSRKQRD